MRPPLWRGGVEQTLEELELIGEKTVMENNKDPKLILAHVRFAWSMTVCIFLNDTSAAITGPEGSSTTR